MRRVTFLGDSLEEIRAFPQGARREVGFQIEKVRQGMEPDNWKPMKTVGTGTREIRVRDETGAFRVIYVATLPEAIYVLHAFRKKTEKTAKDDIDLARRRFSDLMRKQR